MQQLRFWLKVSRPRFWVYIFGPFLIGSISAIYDKIELLNLKFWLFVPFFLIFANLLIYGVNDIFDYETDVLNAKKQDYETLVTPERRRKLWFIIALTTLPFLILTTFQNISAILAMIGFLFFSIFYSAPPIRAKTIPLIDSIFNILYIFPGIFAYFLLGGTNLPWEIVLAGTFWVMAMHAFSAVPDIEADHAAGFKTVATLLGGKGTLIFCAILYLLAGILTFKYLGVFSLLASAAYLAMMLISLWNYSQQHVFAVYRYFPWLNTLIGFALFWFIAFSKFF
ncbi:MAG TPA: prenyltransferase [Pyrinomonadaceae bacterium]|nr:prenyltransferase [Pyrinomonadaceae bacterium]